jgi:hypothetical protein
MNTRQMCIEWQAPQASLGLPTTLTGMRRPNLALGILPLRTTTTLSGADSRFETIKSLKKHHDASKRQGTVYA